MKFKTILVCPDGSEQALNAARSSGNFARQLQANVVLLNVFDDSDSNLPYQSVWQLGISSEAFMRYASQVHHDADSQ